MDVSVLVPAFRADRTLPRCVAALLAQDFSGTYEVIVSASADEAGGLAALDALPAAPRLTVLTQVPRLPARDARHRGVDAATGRLLAFTDADTVADPGWLTALVNASRGGSVIVAGAVVNGTPRSWAGTAEYLLEFSDLSPSRPPEGAWHGALCNLLVPRPLWDRFGPFPELGGGGEDTVFTARARAAGAFAFAPGARVVHLNRTSPRAVVRHHHRLGRFAAHAARAAGPGEYRGGFLVRRPLLAPVAAAARLVAASGRGVRWMPGQRLRAVAGLPLAAVMLAAWAWGVAREGAAIGRRATRLQRHVR